MVGSSKRGRFIFKTARNKNAEELQRINTEIYVAKEYLKNSKDRNEDLNKSFD